MAGAELRNRVGFRAKVGFPSGPPMRRPSRHWSKRVLLAPVSASRSITEGSGETAVHAQSFVHQGWDTYTVELANLGDATAQWPFRDSDQGTSK